MKSKKLEPTSHIESGINCFSHEHFANKLGDISKNGLARTYSLDQNTRGQGSRTSGRSPQGYVQQASCDSMNIKTILYRACDQREEEKRKKHVKKYIVREPEN